MAESEVKFYLAEYRHDTKDGSVREPDVLHFSLTRPGYGGPGMPEHAFSDRAKREHVEGWPKAFKDFRKANPDWKCPLGWEDLDVKVSEPAPVKKASKSKGASPHPLKKPQNQRGSK